KPLRVLGHEALIGCIHQQEHPANCVEQRDISSRRDRQVQIGSLGGRRAARVNNDELLLRPDFLAGTYTVEEHWMRLGHVAADDEENVCQLNIVVTAGRPIAAEARAISGYGGGHAEPAVGVGVVAAQVPFEEFRYQVRGLRIELSAAVEGDR